MVLYGTNRERVVTQLVGDLSYLLDAGILELAPAAGTQTPRLYQPLTPLTLVVSFYFW